MKDPSLTPLGVMILALLREGDMHPYEIGRLLRARRDDRMVSITNGTLYHTISRLHAQGLLDEVGLDREGNRPERTTYTLTGSGFTAVDEWVRRELGSVGRPATFRVALAEAHNLERAEAVDLLRRRRGLLRTELAEYDEGRTDAAVKGVPEQYLLELDRQRVILRAEVDWLDLLLPRLGSPDFPWGHVPEHLLAQRKARHHD